VNTIARPTDGHAARSPVAERIADQTWSQIVSQPEEMIWIDLSGPDRLTLDALQERYGLPPEAITYFLLRHQSAKIIHAGSVLFLVTFWTIPSVRVLFTLQELRLCVTPTRLVTWCGSSGRGQPALARRLPGLPSLSVQSVGSWVCGLLTGVAASYEAIVTLIEERRLKHEPQAERQLQQKRIEKFLRFLRDQRVFFGRVAREGRKLLATEEHQQLLQLEERVDAFARRVWSVTSRRGAEAASPACARVSNRGRNI